MNESHATKHSRRQGKKVTIRVERTKGYFTTKRQRGQAVQEVRRESDHIKWGTPILRRE